MSSPRVTVIVPHLNEPGNLRRCLLSLEAQKKDGVAFEAIVVDNGSQHMPWEALRDLADVRLEREAVPGPGPARNRGAALARGEILAFIDADCVAAEGWVASIAAFMDREPGVGFVGGDIRVLPAEPHRLTAVEAYESVFSYRARRYIEAYGFAATGNMAVRASVFRAVGPFGGIGTMEDTQWGQRATAQGHRGAYLGTAIVSTDSSRSFAELRGRWDRHIAHEYGELGGHPMRVLSWLSRGAILAASPLAEIVTILRSDRISGARAKSLAFMCLARVRLYRARRMLALAFNDTSATIVGSWNRE